MGKTTNIEWCDSTVNPVMGCGGCELWVAGRKTCYAGQLHERRKGQKGFATEFTTPKLFPGRTADAACWPDLTGTDRPDKPWLNGSPRLIFVSDMGDALSETGVVGDDDQPVPDGAVPFEFLKEEIVDVALSPPGGRHRWLWLTKRPKRMEEFFEWLRREHGLGVPGNIWLGTSVTSGSNVSRADALARVGDEHTIRFLSVEPLWEGLRHLPLEGMSWVITGGESRQGEPARPFDVAWARQIREQCATVNVPFFLKQLGSNPRDGERVLRVNDSHGGDWGEWPDDLRVRRVPAPHAAGRVSLPVVTATVPEPAPLPVRRPYTVMSEVEPQPVEWLWDGRIPLGEITLIEGDPAVNKSTMTLDLAARVSRGLPMPTGGPPATPAGVLLLMAEDSQTKTLPLRLRAAGADLNRIAVLSDPITLPADSDVVGESAFLVGARLVVIDPLMAYMGGDSNSDQSVRRTLGPLKALAELTNAAVVLVRHLNKGGGRTPLYRGGGSVGIVAAARAALLVGNDPEDENMRVIAPVKNNLGPMAPSVRFEPVSDENGTVRVEWRGECSYTAGDLLVRPKDGVGKLDKARVFLLAALRDGPVEQKEIERRGTAEGIAYRTLERAKDALGVVSRRRGFGPGSVVVWVTPEAGGAGSAPPT